MAFWYRLRQSRHKFHLFSCEYKRFYTVNLSTIVANQHTRSHTVNRVLDNLDSIVHGRQLEFRNIRFYAAPVQAQKKEERDSSGPRLNEKITAPSIRLVTDEGHHVISRHEALSRARSLKMDLVEVDRNAKPPVCKIMDYNKEKYVQQTKEKERSKSKSTIKKGGCKEVRFAAKIKQNDLKMKADTVKRLMESGYRVKCTAIDPTDNCDLQTLLSRFSALIEDVAIVESAPQVEKKQAFVVVRHVKFGPSKKGSGKKASNAAVSSQNKNEQLKENGSETEPEELSDEDDHIKTKSEWSVFDGDNDINAVFEFSEENRKPKSPILEQSSVVTEPSPYSTDRNPNHVMVNRYARDPTAGKPSRNPMDTSGHSAMNRINSAPQFPNQAKQPEFSMYNNASPQMRPNQAYEAFKQDSSDPNRPNSPTKSYGVFSPQQVNEPQNRPAETNRYKKNGPPDISRSPRNTDPRMNRGPGVGNNNPGEGKWGVFSTDNSSVTPNRNERAESQRR